MCGGCYEHECWRYNSLNHGKYPAVFDCCGGSDMIWKFFKWTCEELNLFQYLLLWIGIGMAFLLIGVSVYRATV